MRSFFLIGCGTTNPVHQTTKKNPNDTSPIPELKRVFMDGGLEKNVEVVSINQGIANEDLLRIQVNLKNLTKKSMNLKYKLEWMDRLNDYCHRALKSEEEIIVMGDFNVIPQYNDCRYPAQWEEDALFAPEVRTKFNYLLNLGYLDAIRILDDSNSIFTQWDYRNRAWEENNGVRIDHILLSPNAADKLEKS